MNKVIETLIKRINFSKEDRKLLLQLGNDIEQLSKNSSETSKLLNAVLESAPEEYDTLKELAEGIKANLNKINNLDYKDVYVIDTDDDVEDYFDELEKAVQDNKIIFYGDTMQSCRAIRNVDENDMTYVQLDYLYTLDGEFTLRRDLIKKDGTHKITYFYLHQFGDGTKFLSNDGTYKEIITEQTKETFTFTVDDTIYTAEKGMSWAQWVYSSYNTGGYGIDFDLQAVYGPYGTSIAVYSYYIIQDGGSYKFNEPY